MRISAVGRQPTAWCSNLFVLRTAAGERKAWPLCVVVEIRDGRITRFQEYIDRAGSFALTEGPVKTPGF